MSVALELAQAPAWAKALIPAALEEIPGSGVWRITGDTITSTITDQFRADAASYHMRYAASAHFLALFRQALAATGIVVAPSPAILDLGSGSGVNSIVPCLELFPGARQVATDLSAELLAILADYARAEGFGDRVLPVVMDAMADHPAAGAFDLVTGASILHHLVNPKRGLEVAARALKPGGHAVFLEPFDGYGLIRLAYQRILAEAELRGENALAPEAAATLRGIATDLTARTMPDVHDPNFAALDDKWLFSRELVEHMARDSGFAEVRFVAHNDHPTLYRDVAGVHLRLGGFDGVSLPDWALAILDEFDAALPGPVKRLLMLEGTIVLTKG